MDSNNSEMHIITDMLANGTFWVQLNHTKNSTNKRQIEPQFI